MGGFSSRTELGRAVRSRPIKTLDLRRRCWAFRVRLAHRLLRLVRVEVFTFADIGCTMRNVVSIAAMTLLVMSLPLEGDDFVTPLIELRSGPLSPGMTLAETPRPIHQFRLVVDTDLKNGKLILDGNPPVFDVFGDLVSGLSSPNVRVREKGDAKLIVELACSIELVKERPDNWRLYHINGRDMRTSLRVSTRGSIADGGSARLVILDADDKVTSVVECVRYGLVTP